MSSEWVEQSVIKVKIYVRLINITIKIHKYFLTYMFLQTGLAKNLLIGTKSVPKVFIKL